MVPRPRASQVPIDAAAGDAATKVADGGATTGAACAAITAAAEVTGEMAGGIERTRSVGAELAARSDAAAGLAGWTRAVRIGAVIR